MRIGALLFLECLARNRLLLLADGSQRIADNAMANAFTLGGIVRDAGLAVEQFRNLL
jgi:hypothetical protein